MSITQLLPGDVYLLDSVRLIRLPLHCTLFRHWEEGYTFANYLDLSIFVIYIYTLKNVFELHKCNDLVLINDVRVFKLLLLCSSH